MKSRPSFGVAESVQNGGLAMQDYMQGWMCISCLGFYCSSFMMHTEQLPSFLHIYSYTG